MKYPAKEFYRAIIEYCETSKPSEMVMPDITQFSFWLKGND